MARKLPIPSTEKQLLMAPPKVPIDYLALMKLFVSTTRSLDVAEAGKRKIYRRVFSPMTTLWGMVLQRLMPDGTLENVVSCFFEGHADSLRGRGKKISSKMKSKKNTSFSDARQRLGLDLIKKAFRQLSQAVLNKVKGRAWKGWNVLLLDGSNLRMHPHPKTKKIFKPSKNQGKTHWSPMQVVGAFCMCTGLMVHSVCGTIREGEVRMACSIILEAGLKSLFVGDSNFGIFRMLQAVRHVKGAAVVAMTKVRAERLGKHLQPGMDKRITWTHSRHDNLLEGASAEPIEGRLLVVRLHRVGIPSFTLYLFTTLLDQELYTVKEIVALYGMRWQVELNLRHIKAGMSMDFLTCKSAEMAKKEWYAGLIAYNLVRSLMLLAADRSGIDPLNLSFASCKRHGIKLLSQWGSGEKVDWKKALIEMGKNRLPNRKKQRPSEPRLKRHIRETFGPLRGSRTAARKKLLQNRCKS